MVVVNFVTCKRCTYIDEHNYCLITHSGDKPVKVFDSGGNLIHSFGSEMQSAQGICITPYGLHGPFIYVCDRDEQKNGLDTNMNCY